MSRVFRRLTLASRLLIIMSIALLISSIVAELYGAKLNSSYENIVAMSPRIATLITIAPITSEGRAKISVEGADNIYYVRVTGDPFIISRQLRSLNFNVTAARPIIDLRAGVAYATIIVGSSPMLIQALSILGNVIPIEQIKGESAIVEEIIKSGETHILLVSVNSEREIKYRVDYTIEGYSRLSLNNVLVVSLGMFLLTVILEFGRRYIRLGVNYV
ncbi:MAG: hypothetical protein QXR02_05445 [Acidilobaceae archaeon]